MPAPAATAQPAPWLAANEPIGSSGVHTRYGVVSVTYEPTGSPDTLRATVHLDLRRQPPRVLLRFPQEVNPRLAGSKGRKSMRHVTVNGRPHPAFDPSTADIDLTRLSGQLTVELGFGYP